MIAQRAGIVVALSMAGVLAGDSMTLGAGQQPADAGKPAAWSEVKWPFPLDQWGVGRAFRCQAVVCGADISLYLRAKLGFCNCAIGVSDDAELDRVGDLELLSARFNGLREGRAITVGWMQGRSRPYQVAMRYGSPRTALAALGFLNGDLVLRWAQKELGL